jgi:type 1 glutamine amidotransferase
MRTRVALFVALATLPVLVLSARQGTQTARPKRLLVVGATAAFRHPSIPNWEIYLRQIAPEFNGQVVMTFMSDAPNYPFSKVPTPNPMGGGGGRGRGGFPGAPQGLTPAQQTAITDASIPLAELNTKVNDARTALASATYGGPATDIRAKVEALMEAERQLALARADAVAKLQGSPNALTTDQLQALAGTAPRGGGPGGGNAVTPQALADLFKQYMSPEALANYDGVFFISTTGNLPLPDEAAFLNWVAQGHAVIGIHAAMDRGNTSDAHMEMLAAGARFNGHPGNANAPSKVVRIDPNFPATRDFPATLDVTDEFYSYHYHDLNGTSGVAPDVWIPGVDYSKVHALLNLDRGDGVAFPVAWAKMHGQGRVFYTSMGHRDDVFMPVPSLDYDGQRDNSDVVNAAFKRHIMGGIRWALGLVDGDARPGNLKVDPKQQVERSVAAGAGRGRGGH